MVPVTLYGFPRSTYVNVARLVLTAKGVAFNFHDTETEMYAPEHLARHPFNRVPVLQHGEYWLYETSAIVQYIDQAFNGPSLQPDDVRERGKMHQWISILNSYFYPYIVFRLVHETLVFPELGIATDDDVVKDAIPKVNLALSVMERELADGRPFIVNGNPTLADYCLLPNLVSLTFAPAGPSMLANFPLVSAWAKRMAALPAVQSVRSKMPPQAPIPHARRWTVDHRAKAG